MNQVYQPLHHKYRPDRFDSLVGQEAIASTLKEALKSNRIAPAYIFTGPRGTGKTSSARIFARSLNCISNEYPTINPCGKCELCKTITLGTALDVIEIDAASNTGVENIRDLIERSRFSPVQARWKVYVIDECHMLSTAAFNALLKTLEEPPPKVVFILATTDPQRVLQTILSRCMRFDFRRIPLKTLIKHLSMIASKEAIEIDNEALELIARRSQGGLRDAESMLDQLSLLPSPIKISSVWDLLGAVPEDKLINLASSLIQNDPKLILSTCRELIDQGKEPIAILQGLVSILRDLVLKKAAPDCPELFNITQENSTKLENISKEIDLELLLQWQASLKGAEQQLRNSSQPKLWLEVLLLGILSKNINNTLKIHPLENIKNKTDQNSKYKINDSNKAINTSNNKEIKENNESKLLKIDLTNKQEELWSKILSKLELPSTKMLLSQQASLKNINHDSVEILVSSKWRTMIESRKVIIEEAISKALNSKRKVVFTSENDNQKIHTKEISTTIQTPSVTSEITTKKINTPNNHIQITKDSNVKDSEKFSIDKKAQQLADFFNGDIINPN